MSANRSETSMFTRFTSAVLAGLMAFLPFNGIRLGGEAKAEEPSLPASPAATPPVVRVMPAYNAPASPSGREVILWGNTENVVASNYQIQPVTPSQWETELGTAIMSSPDSASIPITLPFPAKIYERSSSTLYVSQRGMVDIEPSNETLRLSPPSTLPGTHANLAAWWKMDGNLNDSASDHHGTLVGTARFDPRQSGQALTIPTFDGYATIPHHSDIDLVATSYTLDNWVRVDSIHTTWQPVIPLTPAKMGGFGGLFYLSPANRPYPSLYGTTYISGQQAVALQSSAFTMPLGEWVHVTQTFDAPTKTLRIYVNGQLIASGGSVVADNRGVNNPILIGRQDSHRMTGAYDDIKLYGNRVLSGAEVKALHDYGSMPGLLAFAAAPQLGMWQASGGTSQVHLNVLGDAPNRRAVVSWVNVAPMEGGSPATFQLVLHENGALQYNYQTAASGAAGVSRGDGTLAALSGPVGAGTSWLLRYYESTYTWNPGDNTAPVCGTIEDPRFVSIKHTYAEGHYQPTLTVTNHLGASATVPTTVLISPANDFQAKVNASIQDGLRHLYLTQTPDGSWFQYSPPPYLAGPTGQILLAFVNNGHSPNGPDTDVYTKTVQRGFDYLFSHAKLITNLGTQPAGENADPDNNGVISIDTLIYNSSPKALYEAPMALMAIVASGAQDRVITTGPVGVKNRTYQQVATDMVQYLAWAQIDTWWGVNAGGWRYTPNYMNSDNSISAWPVIALWAAEHHWGISSPTFVKDKLRTYWLPASQSPSGFFGYQGLDSNQTLATTGGGLAGLAFVGVDQQDDRVRRALSYMDTYWQPVVHPTTNATDLYTAFTIAKACRLFSPVIPSIGSHDWYKEYALDLIRTQKASGGWTDTAWKDQILEPHATAWAILILTPTLIGPAPYTLQAVAKATPDNAPATTPITLNGSDSTCSDRLRTIVDYRWDFDGRDGVDFNAPDAVGPIAVMPGYPVASGDYTVTASLQVTDDLGKTATATCDIRVTTWNQPPIANAGGPYYRAFRGQYVFFDGSNSADPNAGMPICDRVVSWAWDFDGDGAYDDATGPKPWFRVDEVFQGAIALQVADSYGLTSTAVSSVPLGVIEPPIVSITTSPGYYKNHLDLVEANLPITLGGTVVTTRKQAKDILSANASGDGTGTLMKHLLAAKLNVKLFFIGDMVLANTGQTVSQIIAEGDRLLIEGGTKTQITAQASLLDRINNAGLSPDAVGLDGLPTTSPPAVTVTMHPAQVTAGQPVQFQITTQTANPDIGILFRNLTVGGVPVPVALDGTATFSPTASGTLDVVATCLDYAGKTGTGQASLSVTADTELPVVSVAAMPAELVIGGSTTIQVAAHDNVGIALTEVTLDGKPLCGAPMVFTPPAVGVYHVVATVTDLAGNVATAGTDIVVLSIDVTSPQIAVTAEPSRVTLGGTVTVTVMASDDRGPLGTRLYVDGKPIDLDPSGVVHYVTDRPGTIPVLAYTTDGGGNIATANASFRVLLPDTTPPTVSVIVTPALVNVGEPVYISVIPKDNVGVTSVGLKVDGSDVNLDADYKAVYRPTAAMVYPVSATATDEIGNVGTGIAQFVAELGAAPRPIVNLTVDKRFPLVGEKVYITATASTNNPPVNITVTVNNIPQTPDASGRIEFTPVLAAQHTVEARAVDSLGYEGRATDVFVAVEYGTGLPAVAVKTPVDGQDVKGEIEFSAEALDNSGSGVEKVVFYVDDVAVGDPDTAAPYAIALNTTLYQDGFHNLRARVTDNLGKVADSTIIEIRVDNTAPTVTLTAPAANTLAHGSLNVAANATDNTKGSGIASVRFYAGDRVMATTSTAPYETAIDTTSLADGAHTLYAAAVDKAGNRAETSTINISVDNTLPAIDLVLTPMAVDLGDAEPDTITLSATITDANALNFVTLRVNGSTVPINRQNGTSVWTASYVPVAAGGCIFEVTARDAAGNVNVASAQATVTAPDDSINPLAAIASPAGGTRITSPIPVTGTASDDHLAEYRLEIAPKGSAVFTLIGRGTASVVNGELGKLDPTLLANDFYMLRLTVRDVQNNITTAEVEVSVEGDLKIGNFHISMTDFSVPMTGIPITVGRTFDTLWKGQDGEFGFGWKLDLASVDLKEDKGHNVILTLPDGRRASFKFTPQFPYPMNPQYAAPAYTPAPGVYYGLFQQTYSGDILFFDGEFLGMDLKPYDPNRYVLTRAGDQYHIAQPGPGTTKGRMTRVLDRNGNSIDFTNEGILHSSGKNLLFDRDGQGRISALTYAGLTSVRYHYSEAGDLVAVDRLLTKDDATEKWATTQFVYVDHNCVRIVDPRGVSAIVNEYDPVTGRLVKHTDANGKTITYDHQIDAKREVVTDRNGYSTTYEYNNEGLVTSVTNAQGGFTAYGYDQNKNLVSETNPAGETWQYACDGLGYRTAVTDPQGNVSRATYNPFGNPERIIDARGLETAFTYDDKGNLVSIKDTRDNAATIEHDERGLLTKTTDPLGNTIRYFHDDTGRVIEQDMRAADGTLLRVTSFTYDEFGRQLTRTAWRMNEVSGDFDPYATTTNTYDAAGRLAAVTDPLGHSSYTSHDESDRPIASTDKNGNVTKFYYNTLGQLVKTEFPAIDTPSGRVVPAEEFGYDDDGNQTCFKDRNGNVTCTEYDALKRPIKVINPDGTLRTTTYDTAGRVWKQTDERNNTTEFGYNAAGRRIWTKDPLGKVSTVEYDAAGKQTASVDALGRRTEFRYNEVGLQYLTIFHTRTTKTVEYDSLGRRMAVIDEAGIRTEFAYAATGELVEVRKPDPSDSIRLTTLTKFEFDTVGRKIRQIDALGRVTAFTWNSRNEMTERILPLGQTEHFTYDKQGNLESRTDLNGNTTAYFYNALNLISAKRPDPRSGEPAVFYSYNALGQRALMYDASGSTTHVYDGRNRLLEKTSIWGSASSPSLSVSLCYTYDSSGNVLNIRSSTPGGVSTAYSYDAANRLCEVLDSNAGRTAYAYDDVGNLQGVIYPNGLEMTYEYDPLNRLTNLSANGNQTAIANYHYTVGPAGNRLTASEVLVTGASSPQPRTIDRVFRYDTNYRLVGEEIVGAGGAPAGGILGYDYDLVGNRLARRSTVAGVPAASNAFDANDHLLSDQYDANGNTISGHVTQNSPSVADQYDFENRLVRRFNPDGTTVEILCDGDGNRVRKTVTASGKSVTTYYVVDTVNPTSYAQVLEEWSAENGGPAAVSRVYGYGLDLISQARPDSGHWVMSYYGYDGHGSVRYLTDAAGAVTDTYDYEAFGTVISRTGSTPNHYLFTGEQFDPDLGLYFLRARYHNPDTGRFWTADAFEGFSSDPASLHKYTYVQNNPVNAVDPSGLLSGSLNEQMMVSAIIGFMFGAIVGGYSAFRKSGNQFGMHIVWGAMQGAFMGAVIGAIAPSAMLSELGRWFMLGLLTFGAKAAIDELKDGCLDLALLYGLMTFTCFRGFRNAPPVSEPPPLPNELPSSAANEGNLSYSEMRQSGINFTDRMSGNQYRKLVESIMQCGLQNKVINYVKIGNEYYILLGNNRVMAAQRLEITDQLIFEEVKLPFKGFETTEDVINAAAVFFGRY